MARWLPRCVLACLLGQTAFAQTGAIAELVAAQEALKGVKESIEKAKVGAQDTVNIVQADISTNLVKVQSLIDQLRKGVIKDTDVIIGQTIDQVNQTLHNAMEGSFALEAAASQDMTNALLNAAKVLSGLHLSARPFVALSWPTTILPGTTQDGRIHILGHFKADWPKPEVALEGKRLTSSLGVNEVEFDLPRDLIARYSGRRMKFTVTYPVENAWYWPTKYETRDIAVAVLPQDILSFKVLVVEGENPTEFVPAQKSYDFNTEAGKSDTSERNIVISRDDALGGFDFVNTYDLAKSRITGAAIVLSDGNNPDGQNGSSVGIDALGTQAILHQKARGSSDHGCPFACRWGEGANRHDRMIVTVALARKATTSGTKLVGGPAEGNIRWGKEVDLSPSNVGLNLTKLKLEITDYSYDPPVTRVLNLGDMYRESPFVTVKTTPEGIALMARSSPRK
jgi:hypothetical protein